MSYIDEINSFPYLYLLDLSEPEDNVLRLVVAEGQARQGGHRATQEFKPLGPLSSTSVPIIVTEGSATFEIIFRSYIAYAVLNESFTVTNAEEQFVGTTFRTYSRSAFLDYISAATIASDDYGGPYSHYGVVCLNHIIDIASSTIPEVTRLRSSTVRQSLQPVPGSSSARGVPHGLGARSTTGSGASALAISMLLGMAVAVAAFLMAGGGHGWISSLWSATAVVTAPLAAGSPRWSTQRAVRRLNVAALGVNLASVLLVLLFTLREDVFYVGQTWHHAGAIVLVWICAWLVVQLIPLYRIMHNAEAQQAG